MVEDTRHWQTSSRSAEADKKSTRALGLPDSAFEQRKPLSGQITKREVRAVSLYLLGLRRDSVIWDIGAGTGSVTVEAALIAHQGAVYAIERDEPSLSLLQRNLDRWGSPNIHVVAGEAPSVLDTLPNPDAVFVGGSGGKLNNILDTVARRVSDCGRIVVNLAVLERTQETCQQLGALGFATELSLVSAARGKEMPDGATRLEALNPVFVVAAWRRN